MANLTATSSFDDVLQLETTHQAIGGAGGTMNLQAQALLNRTEFLAETKVNIADLNAFGLAPMYVARAWANFNGAGTIIIRDSGNISSVTDLGVGHYQLNFTTAMPDANYAVSGFCTYPSNTAAAGLVSFGNDYYQNLNNTFVKTSNSTSGTVLDSTYIHVTVTR